ncbi:MAG TPA: hypothetical protein VM711_09010, partial [Sphingomicrobium sp.]|nr:hypothetical protein [Sphingomicrobium sp.]
VGVEVEVEVVVVVVVAREKKTTLAELAASVLPVGRYEFRARFGRYFSDRRRVVIALLPVVRLDGQRRTAVNGEDFDTVFATFPLAIPRFVADLKRLAAEAKISEELPLGDFAEAFAELRLVGDVFCRTEPYRDVKNLTVLK